MCSSIWDKPFQQHVSRMLWEHELEKMKKSGASKRKIAKSKKVFDAFAGLREELGQEILDTTKGRLRC